MSKQIITLSERAAERVKEIISDERRMVLVGMHPRRIQSPPRGPGSTIATLAPWDLAEDAAAYPAEPAPRIAISNSMHGLTNFGNLQVSSQILCHIPVIDLGHFFP